jgi:hypothetical protein
LLDRWLEAINEFDVKIKRTQRGCHRTLVTP